jgi:hypothetical protein
MHIIAAMIAQGPFDFASRYRGPLLGDVRENAIDFDSTCASLANTYVSCA